MKRIKLVGFMTYPNKNGGTTLIIHFVTNDKLTCKEGFMCGGTAVDTESMRFRSDLPLQIGSTYDLEYEIKKFQGRNDARLVNMILVK